MGDVAGFGWDDEDEIDPPEHDHHDIDDPYLIEIEDLTILPDSADSFEELRRSIVENKAIADFLKNAYSFGGESTLIEVLNSIERKMGWRTEILADKSALDDYLFYRYGLFDDEAWDSYINSDEFDDFSAFISELSQAQIFRFADRHARQLSIRDTIRECLKKLAIKHLFLR